MAANNLGKAQKLTAGRKLRIPDASVDQGTPKTAALTAKPEKAKTVQKYTVQRGDNLFAIAEKFNTTTKNIMAANKLTGTTLTVGQSLTIASGKQISAPKEAVTRYKVKNGDSPLSIAKKYKIPVDRLLALNHLSKKSKIFPGQNLIIQ